MDGDPPDSDRARHGIPPRGDHLWRHPGGRGYTLDLSQASDADVASFLNAANHTFILYMDTSRPLPGARDFSLRGRRLSLEGVESISLENNQDGRAIVQRFRLQRNPVSWSATVTSTARPSGP